MAYYIAKVKVATDTPKGIKWQSETYLVDALTVTHAESIVNEDFKDSGVEFEVKSISKFIDAGITMSKNHMDFIKKKKSWNKEIICGSPTS